MFGKEKSEKRFVVKSSQYSDGGTIMILVDKKNRCELPFYSRCRRIKYYTIIRPRWECNYR